MLKYILKYLFNIKEDREHQNENVFKISQQKGTGQQAKEATRSRQHVPQTNLTHPQTNNVDVTALFYSLLFQGGSEYSGGIANSLEKQVILAVNEALASPQQLADNIILLPRRLIELDNQLKDPATNIEDILALIQQDPVLSVEVLKLSNSPAFRYSQKEITRLSQAVVQLGREQIRHMVTTCMVKDMMDIKPIYFRRFGAQIWRHSQQVAWLTGQFSQGKKAEDAFLIAILHDIGKIAIFKILVDAFASAEEGEVPCSSLFRQVMTARSLLLSAMLSGCWNLPETITKTLSQLATLDGKKPQVGITQVIWRANLVSEIYMLNEAEMLEPDVLADLQKKAGVTQDEFDALSIHLKEIQ